MAAAPIIPIQTVQARQRRTIPFDYSFRFALAGRVRNSVNATITVSVEAAFVAHSIGYGFVPKAEPVRFGGTARELLGNADARNVTLQNIPFSSIVNLAARKLGEDALLKQQKLGPQTAALLEAGVRINPEFARQVVNGGPGAALDPSMLDRLFELVPPSPRQVQFLYSLFDQGTGRAFQSEPVLSTAGLGDPEGKRPFRQFSAPIVFEPRTVIRMEITELDTAHGDLHVCLQGYKVLGGSGTPTGSAATAEEAGRARRGRRR